MPFQLSDVSQTSNISVASVNNNLPCLAPRLLRRLQFGIAASPKNQVLTEIIQKSPNGRKMAPNDQKHVILIIWDHFGPF